MADSTITRTTTVKLTDLKPFPGNSRRGDLDLIRESLRMHGQYRTIVVQESTGYVVAGNHTVDAAEAEGWEEIEATFIDVDDAEALAINLVDNRANDMAINDPLALAEQLQRLNGRFDGTGFTAVDLDALLLTLNQGGWSTGDKDAAPELPEDPVTKPGDIIQLGRHLLVCGDALNPDDRDALLDGKLADLVVTDPPYTVRYEEDMSEGQAARRRQDGKKVGQDDLVGPAADHFIESAMTAIRDSVKPGGVFYTFAPPGLDELRFRDGLREAKLPLHQVILWVKDRFVFGRSDYHWRHELLLYGWRDGAAHYFDGGRSQDTLWEYDRPATSKLHPTQKPVELLERAITNSSRAGEVVVDLFAGSGSTLVAAASAGRRALLMEKDPAYCDCIVERWETLTKEKVR